MCRPPRSSTTSASWPLSTLFSAALAILFAIRDGEEGEWEEEGVVVVVEEEEEEEEDFHTLLVSIGGIRCN